MSPIYLYGIVEAPTAADLGFTGIGGVSPVHIVACQGLGAVVSDYQGGEVGTLPKDQLVRCLLAHQETIEKVIQQGYSVLPVKFGTLFSGRQETLALLAQTGPRLAGELARIQGRVEVEVAATWPVDEVLRQIGQEEEVVRARAAVAGPGPPTLADQIQLGEVVKKCLDQRRQIYEERILSVLGPIAVDLVSNALISDALVANLAFLLEKDRLYELDSRVQELDRLFREEELVELDFRVIGPLPPYSFNTLEITPLTLEEVEAAMWTLCLEAIESVAQMKQAFRRLAAGEQSQSRLTRLRQAADLLTAYLSIGHPAPDLRQQPGFLLSSRRAESQQFPHVPQAEVGLSRRSR